MGIVMPGLLLFIYSQTVSSQQCGGTNLANCGSTVSDCEGLSKGCCWDWSGTPQGPQCYFYQDQCDASNKECLDADNGKITDDSTCGYHGCCWINGTCRAKTGSCLSGSEKVDCGAGQAECEAKMCCWDPDNLERPCSFSRDECSNVTSRDPCGTDGITSEQCEKLGCCWDEIHCFYRYQGCNVSVSDRESCDGIQNENLCYQQGCCWDDNQCYRKKFPSQTTLISTEITSEIMTTMKEATTSVTTMVSTTVESTTDSQTTSDHGQTTVDSSTSPVTTDKQTTVQSTYTTDDTTPQYTTDKHSTVQSLDTTEDTTPQYTTYSTAEITTTAQDTLSTGLLVAAVLVPSVIVTMIVIIVILVLRKRSNHKDNCKESPPIDPTGHTNSALEMDDDVIHSVTNPDVTYSFPDVTMKNAPVDNQNVNSDVIYSQPDKSKKENRLNNTDNVGIEAVYSQPDMSKKKNRRQKSGGDDGSNNTEPVYSQPDKSKKKSDNGENNAAVIQQGAASARNLPDLVENTYYESSDVPGTSTQPVTANHDSKDYEDMDVQSTQQPTLVDKTYFYSGNLAAKTQQPEMLDNTYYESSDINGENVNDSDANGNNDVPANVDDKESDYVYTYHHFPLEGRERDPGVNPNNTD